MMELASYFVSYFRSFRRRNNKEFWPTLKPDFRRRRWQDDTVDLGERVIGGSHDGQAVQRMRIHEVWTSAEQIIVQVIDGDPSGEETVWGLEKISLTPDPTLFRPPDD